MAIKWRNKKRKMGIKVGKHFSPLPCEQGQMGPSSKFGFREGQKASEPCEGASIRTICCGTPSLLSSSFVSRGEHHSLLASFVAKLAMKSSLASLDPTTATLVLRKLASLESRPPSGSSNATSNATAVPQSSVGNSSSANQSPIGATFPINVHPTGPTVTSNASNNNIHLHTMASLAHHHHLNQHSSPQQQPSPSQQPTPQSPLSTSNTSGHNLALMSMHLHGQQLPTPTSSPHSPSPISLVSNSRSNYLTSQSPLLAHHLVTSMATNQHFQAALTNGLANPLIYRPNPLLLRPSDPAAASPLNQESPSNFSQLLLMPTALAKNRSQSESTLNSIPVEGKTTKVVSGQIWRPHIQVCDQPTNLSSTNRQANADQPIVPPSTLPNDQERRDDQLTETKSNVIRSKIDERISKLFEFNKRIRHDSVDSDDCEFELDSDLEEREVFSSISSDDEDTITDLPRIQLTPPPQVSQSATTSTAAAASSLSSTVATATAATTSTTTAAAAATSTNSSQSNGRGRRTRGRSKKIQPQQPIKTGVDPKENVPVRETKYSFLSRLDLVPAVEARDFKFQKFLKSRVFYERPCLPRRTSSTSSSNGNQSSKKNRSSNASNNNSLSNNKKQDTLAHQNSSGSRGLHPSMSSFNDVAKPGVVSKVLPPMVPINDAKIAFFNDILQLSYLPPGTSFDTIQKPIELHWSNVTNLTKDVRQHLPPNNISPSQLSQWLEWYSLNEERFKRENRVKKAKEAMAKKEMSKLTNEMKIRLDKLRPLVLNHAPLRLEHVDYLTRSLEKLANSLCSQE